MGFYGHLKVHFKKQKDKSIPNRFFPENVLELHRVANQLRKFERKFEKGRFD